MNKGTKAQTKKGKSTVAYIRGSMRSAPATAIFHIQGSLGLNGRRS